MEGKHVVMSAVGIAIGVGLELGLASAPWAGAGGGDVAAGGAGAPAAGGLTAGTARSPSTSSPTTSVPVSPLGSTVLIAVTASGFVAHWRTCDGNLHDGSSDWVNVEHDEWLELGIQINFCNFEVEKGKRMENCSKHHAQEGLVACLEFLNDGDGMTRFIVMTSVGVLTCDNQSFFVEEHHSLEGREGLEEIGRNSKRTVQSFIIEEHHNLEEIVLPMLGQGAIQFNTRQTVLKSYRNISILFPFGLEEGCSARKEFQLNLYK